MKPRVLAALVALIIGGCPNPNANENANEGANENTNDNSAGNGNSNSSAPTGIDVVADVTADLPAPVEPAPQGAPASTALVNEVRFLAADARPQFVELKTAPSADLGGFALVNETGARFTLPTGATSNPAGFVLVLFDATSSVVPGEVHGDVSGFLNSVAGSLRLLDASSQELDRVSWSSEPGGDVRLGRGGVPLDPEPGMTIGRLPQSADPGPYGWVSFSPVEATPGGPNPNPGVSIVFPFSGEISDAGTVELSWYPVENADRYEVELADTSDFASLRLTVSVVDPWTSVDLPEGTYYWRVRAVATDETLSDNSPTAVLIVRTLANIPQEGSPKLRQRGASARGPEVLVDPAFPRISQHKDTKMLLLESNRTNAGHRWDQAHDNCDTRDKADNMNCALASTAMVNHFYGGDISQDRLGYELYKNRRPGAERDLNYGDGAWPHQALSWALQVAISRIPRPGSEDKLEELIRGEVDAKRPLVLTIGNKGGLHALVAVGYQEIEGDFYVIVNDPWNNNSTAAAQKWWPLAYVYKQLHSYCPIPAGALIKARGDEPELKAGTDSDGDGIIDFDERERFGTRWEKAGDFYKDSDGDCIEDKREIELSMFTPGYGYALAFNVTGAYLEGRDLNGDDRDVDGDTLRAELDTDSDNGGLPDFVEDLNQNGTIEPDSGESNPFDKRDDARHITGTQTNVKDRDDSPDHFIQTTTIVFDLHSKPDGTVTGTANIKQTAHNTLMAVADPPECPEPRIITSVYDEISKDGLKVEGEWVCTDGAKGPSLIVHPVDFATFSIQVHYSDPCRGPSVSLPFDVTLGAGGTFASVATNADGSTFEAFTATKARVEWKAKTRTSVLQTEKGFYTEWDIVMTPE